MSFLLFSHVGGQVARPERVLCDRRDGGHLVVHPPRPVWERSALSPRELMDWSLLVAATGQAMLEVLPTLEGGCLNYWEAGNWALNERAAPMGPKQPREHRRVHLHLFGRSPRAVHRDWRWGESPRFPDFADVERWCAGFEPLTPDEGDAIASRAQALLATRYRWPSKGAGA